MSYEIINSLFNNNTALKLLKSDNAALVVSFFIKIFKEENRFYIPENEILSSLEDHLYSINQPEVIYQQPAKKYLSDWTQEGTGFMRKYYESGDEPLYELTPATETALKWIDELSNQRFIGTESRLKLLLDILRELSSKSKRDIYGRIKELEAEKIRIEKEIEEAKQGFIEVLDERQIEEQFFNAEETAKRLLSDFRQVEQNFRDIDKEFRKKIITTTKAKGRVLDELFGQQDYMWTTDQGKSFKAFWEFLMSQVKQEELENLLDEVLNLPLIKQRIKEETITIPRIKNNLIEAGDKVNKSTGSLMEQLRKYVEHKSFLENKRIHENINELLRIISEETADFSKNDTLLHIDDVIKLDFILERPLYNPPQKIKFKNTDITEGESTDNNDSLYDQFHIDLEELKSNIKTALKSHSQISLKDLIEQFEVKKGMAEVVGYIEIAAKESKNVFYDSMEEIIISNIKTDKTFKVKIPKIIYCK